MLTSLATPNELLKELTVVTTDKCSGCEHSVRCTTTALLAWKHTAPSIISNYRFTQQQSRQKTCTFLQGCFAGHYKAINAESAK